MINCKKRKICMNMKVNYKNSIYVIIFLLSTCLYISCSKEEKDTTDTYANELKAKLIGTWIDGRGREQYVFESSGTANWTYFANDGPLTSYFKYEVKQFWGDGSPYEVVFEDIGYGDGGHFKIEFLSYDELKLGGTLFYRK